MVDECCGCRDREKDDLEDFHTPEGRARTAQFAHESQETLQRHIDGTGGFSELMLYWIEEPNHGGSSQTRSPSTSSRPTARQVLQNAPAPVPVKSANFEGHILWIQRLPENAPPEARGDKWQSYFSRRQRKWELRLQGRFKKVPKGKLYAGIVLRDFNYNQAVAWHSKWAKGVGMSLMPMDDAYAAWGDRCEAAKQPDAELSHLVSDMAGWDQIIVTPAGEEPPNISYPLQGKGMERKLLGTSHYTREVRTVIDNFNTKDTYTFAFWGVSSVVDVAGWQFKFPVPRGTIDMTNFFQEWPMHACLYELDDSTMTAKDTRHLESRKRYLFDLMFWNSGYYITEDLCTAYNFKDTHGFVATPGLSRNRSTDSARPPRRAPKEMPWWLPMWLSKTVCGGKGQPPPPPRTPAKKNGTSSGSARC